LDPYITTGAGNSPENGAIKVDTFIGLEVLQKWLAGSNYEEGSQML
jgi:hypothetical protein